MLKLTEAGFLGFRIIRGRVRWTEKSKKKFESEVRKITGRTRGVSPARVIEELKNYVRGAVNHYVIGLNFAEARELDQWMRRRTRLYYWKQWGRPRPRRRRLLRLGIGRDEVKLASRSRKGPQRMSGNSIVQRAMSNAWLKQQGVPSIKEQWISIRYPNGPKGPKG